MERTPPIPPTPDAAAAAPSPTSLASAPTDRLLHLWRMSAFLLREADSPAWAAVIVSRRQDYLDELERRDPALLDRLLTEADGRP